MMIPEYERQLFHDQLSEATIANYSGKVRTFLKWLTIDIAECGKDTIQEFMQHLLMDRKAKSETRKIYLLALRSYFNFLMTKGIFKENPTAGIPLPKKQSVPPDALTEDEIKLILLATFDDKSERGMRDLAIISFLTVTGCRIGVIPRLRISDFKKVKMFMPSKCPHCQQPILGGRLSGKGQQIESLQATIREKGGKIFPVLVHEKAEYYLQQHLARRKTGAGTDNIFCSLRRGKASPMDVSAVRGMIRRRAKQAGIDRHITPHAFRHSAITYWLDMGIDVESVGRFVGHRNLMTTLAYKNKSMRSFIQAGISRGKSIFDSISTPLDVMIK